MSTYRLTNVSDDVLLRGLATLVAQDRTTTANLLAHMAEVDARRLYAPAGCSSMHAYCVEKLGLSDDAAWKRLQVAKKVRQFPQLCVALAEGRVHLSGLTLLMPHVTPENVDELLSAATGKRKSEIEVLVAGRFPQVEILRLDEGISALRPPTGGHVNLPVASIPPSPAPGQVEVPTRVSPISAQRFALQVTIEQATRDKLRYAQDLLGSASDVATVFDRALDALISQLERQKFAATDKPRRPRKATRARTIPAHVRRSVRKDEKPRCAFVGEDGHRCTATRFVEFDHIVPVALGGEATVEQVRLLCRTHNRLEAERVLGRDFMEAKRAGASMVFDAPAWTGDDLPRGKSAVQNSAGGRYTPKTLRRRSEISPSVACASTLARMCGSRLSVPRAACSSPARADSHDEASRDDRHSARNRARSASTWRSGSNTLAGAASSSA